MIGCGSVTELKSGPAFSKIAVSSLVIVMRRTKGLAEDYAKRHGVPRWTTDANEVIHDPEVNAVYIATPPSSHAEYAIKVAMAGKPAYVEKPMGICYKESERILEAFKTAGLPLFVAYYRRCLPNFVKVRELVRTGAIGQVRALHLQLHRPAKETDVKLAATAAAAAAAAAAGGGGGGGTGEVEGLRRPWRVDPLVAGKGGYFRDLASHQLNYLEYVFGPVVHVSAIARNLGKLYPTEDTVMASLEFESGVVGTGNWCFASSKAGDCDFCEIYGDHGKIRFSFFQSSLIEVDSGGATRTEMDLPYPPHVQQPLLQTVMAALRGEGLCPSTGDAAAQTDRVLDAILGDADGHIEDGKRLEGGCVTEWDGMGCIRTAILVVIGYLSDTLLMPSYS
ncbi:hypothetical protein CBR_g8590 [Chara braunii]|uniref:Gfo/Idh/MocA-like oxidoreductase N-terminal domain-containing protein n=1 Tax=Chara braunii TaxID=69332 RepID=A0A388JRZ5_CHABU|nr:hypothetical protein CBR_g8590 [Chara braunii]|eukprot:GBG60568.1 hypothetical protein CBR_g8590 [Chara braunii]